MSIIILPGEVTQSFKFVCHGCGKGFYGHEARGWVQHTTRCVDERRAGEMMAELKRRMPFPDIGDVEFERWVRQHADEILEGRVRM